MSMDGYASIPGLSAGADLSSNQYRAVRLDTANDRRALAITANTQVPIGVQQDDPNAAGQPIDVACVGICKMEYGGTITRGDTLGISASGTAVSITPGTDTTRYVIGYALESGSNGDIRDIMLALQGRAA